MSLESTDGYAALVHCDPFVLMIEGSKLECGSAGGK